MHETAIAQSLVEMISEEARIRRARPVRAKVSCGELAAVSDEALSFAFEALAQGTACEGMQLRIEHKPLRALCKICDGVFVIDLCGPQCPNCGGEDFTLLPDAPLLLEEVEFEQGADDEEGGRGPQDPERQ
jgi:hydrogenase nickel incorporation protein HypA/HybF